MLVTILIHFHFQSLRCKILRVPQNIVCVAWVFWQHSHEETILATVTMRMGEVILWLATLVLALKTSYGYFYVLSKCFKTVIMFTSITPQAQYQLLTKIAPIYVKILTSLHCANYHIHQHQHCIFWRWETLTSVFTMPIACCIVSKAKTARTME